MKTLVRKSRQWNTSPRACLKAGVIMSVSLGLISCSREDSDPSKLTVPKGQHKARYELIVENATSRKFSRGMLWLYAPVTDTTSADIPQAKDLRLVTDNLGNRQLTYRFDEIPKNFEHALSLTVDVVSRTAVFSETKVPPSEFRSGEFLIEVDDPKIRDQAAALKGVSVAQTVENVSDFLATFEKNILISKPDPTEIQREPRVRGALAVLEDSRADDLDRVLLAAALLRAVSVPARIVGGVLDDGDGVLATSEMNIWIEYLGEKGWRSLFPYQVAETISPIVFRIFDNAASLRRDHPANNFHEGVGLRIRVAQ